MIAEFSTVSGRFIDLARFSPDDVDIEDVAHHLAWTCRYNGAVCDWYNNAQHSYLVGEIAEAIIGPVAPINYEVALDVPLTGHLHDANEAYGGDFTRPMKQLLRFAANLYGLRSPVDTVEEMLHSVIERAFELPLTCLSGTSSHMWDTEVAREISRIVKRADNLALVLEDAALRPHVKATRPPELSGVELVADPAHGAWGRERAKALFLDRYHTLVERRQEARPT